MVQKEWYSYSFRPASRGRNCVPAMVLGFRVLRLCVLPHRRILTRGRKSKTVTHPKQTKPRTLTVRRTFEVSRVAQESLATAYEQLVPLVRRSLPTLQEAKEETPAAPKRRLGRI
jgi:hypothetical protein